ncbi:MAG TPA: histidinol-phosphate transaminase [Cytophagaceae bacterium]
MFNLDNLLRENIKNVVPYASARDEYKGSEGIFLDANENPLGAVCGGEYNRYPDPLQRDLKEKIAGLKRVHPSQIFLGNGSDEAIDLLMRAVCNPGKDNIIITPPTYGMYEVSAGINDVKVKEVPLTEEYQLQPENVLKAVDANTKIIFLCSPNNPTGNILNTADIKKVVEGFNGLVVIDEAYIDFAPGQSFLTYLNQYPNLIVLQTFSKAWGLAGLRLGMAFASEAIIKVYNKIKFPYNVNVETQRLAMKALDNLLQKEKMVEEILDEREKLVNELKNLDQVIKIFPSHANFILVKTKDGRKVYEYLVSKQIITRDRSKVALCEGSLRISIGTAEENKKLVEALKQYK